MISVGQARFAVFVAVFLQSIGKVAYGTWLQDFPPALFVLISFALTAVFFLCWSGKGVGDLAWGPIVLLNVATALTFLSFFYALKLIEPAIVGAIEIGIGPIIAVFIAFFITGEKPSLIRVFVCFGILAGCAILGGAALSGTGFSSAGETAWVGLGASAAAGVGAVLITVASKSLLERGWKFGAVLAHRFYVILPLSLVLTFMSDTTAINWTFDLAIILGGVSIIGVLAPLYLLLVGISRCDTYTVMVTMSSLPVLTFVIEGFSPLYTWSWATMSGLAVVSAFLALDIIAKNTGGKALVTKVTSIQTTECTDGN